VVDLCFIDNFINRQSLLGLNLGGDAVKIPPALGGEFAAAVGSLLSQLEVLQRLQSFPRY